MELVFHQRLELELKLLKHLVEPKFQFRARAGASREHQANELLEKEKERQPLLINQQMQIKHTSVQGAEINGRELEEVPDKRAVAGNGQAAFNAYKGGHDRYHLYKLHIPND